MENNSENLKQAKLREWLRKQAINSCADYHNSGKYPTGKEVSDFLRSGKTGELLECHRCSDTCMV